jgi:arsenate reductase (thioredoxin)
MVFHNPKLGITKLGSQYNADLRNCQEVEGRYGRGGHTQPTGDKGAAGYVHPRAMQTIAEIGIAHEGRSKHADDYRGVSCDMVVMVCDAVVENCPVWLGPGKRVHLGFPDPARVTGTEDEVLAAFRRVRDDIAQQAVALLSDIVA